MFYLGVFIVAHCIVNLMLVLVTRIARAIVGQGDTISFVSIAMCVVYTAPVAALFTLGTYLIVG